jgi:hypothetical protein
MSNAVAAADDDLLLSSFPSVFQRAYGTHPN